MAYILLVDPNPVARRALNGILARAGHRMAAVDSEPDAWNFIRQTVKVDLVFTDLKLSTGSGLGLVERLKNDCLLKYLPEVVYAENGDRESVKRALGLRVQNFLVKPYHDTEIFGEIKKATANPWRNRHFEEEKSFCKMMGLKPPDLHRMLDQLQTALTVEVASFKELAGQGAVRAVGEKATLLSGEAEAAGAWGVVECLGELGTLASESKWDEFVLGLEQLQFAAKLIHLHLNPNLVPPEYLTGHELHALQDEQARAIWFDAPKENRCPVVDWPQIQRALDALPGCPVIDSAAAAFQMAANGHPSCLNPLMDLVDNDPGLAAQMLIAANQLKHSDAGDEALLEDPRLAVGRLGEQRLATQAGTLLTAEERHMQLPPILDWPRYWRFQTGVAHMARFTCRYLELYSMEPTARCAGLLHDLGKLLLLRLHPLALQAIIDYSRQHQISLPEAERYFLGCTTADMAAYFAEKHGLPRRYANVMRWIGAPAEAPEDAVLVAVVSLARDLCRQNNVGAGGDVRQHRQVALEETAEWRVLRESVFPSFDLRKFELQMHADCRELKLEQLGRLTTHAAA